MTAHAHMKVTLVPLIVPENIASNNVSITKFVMVVPRPFLSLCLDADLPLIVLDKVTTTADDIFFYFSDK